jgi:L-methionine (R)-S-oxide reductase
VCGAAVAKRQTIVVPNVREFPGHIACDPASNSVIVLPLLLRDRVLGVLDIDSLLADRFDADDAAGLQAIVTSLLATSDVAGEDG